jgi:hypothetical protein
MQLPSIKLPANRAFGTNGLGQSACTASSANNYRGMRRRIPQQNFFKQPD